MIERLRKKLWYLRESHGIAGVKGGTEVEDLNFDELTILRKISHGIMPMIIKIGGPEARNDIRYCLNTGIEGILAPMIESDYALSNFVETIRDLADFKFQSLFLAINLETITGYSNINPIINNSCFKYIHQVTVGRTDLAGSMEYPVNHKEVMNITEDIVNRVKKHNKSTSVGGKIDALIAQQLKDQVQPDKINTRHLSIDLAKSKNLTFSICEALSFEIELYKLYMSEDSEKEKAYSQRIEDTKIRMRKRDIAFLPSFR